MKLKIKRFDKNLPLPAYKSKGAAALDLSARLETKILPNQVGHVPLNIALELPPNHWAMLVARSSLHKKGLMMVNGVGVGDEDYCGDNDEYGAILFNFTKQEVIVKKGERLVQLIILQREKVELEVVEKLNNQDRGGVGSTGF